MRTLLLEKRIKILVGLTITAYALLILSMANLMTPVLDDYREWGIVHAPTIDCVSPQSLDDVLKCTGGDYEY